MIFVGADHAGFDLKNKLVEHLKKKHEVEDFGTFSDESTDYPNYAVRVARAVLKEEGSFGILICGTGLGMCMTANKVDGIRAAAVSESKSAEMARAHNNAQVLCLGARIVDLDTAIECVDTFLKTEFDADHPRHARRVEKIAKVENGEEL